MCCLGRERGRVLCAVGGGKENISSSDSGCGGGYETTNLAADQKEKVERERETLPVSEGGEEELGNVTRDYFSPLINKITVLLFFLAKEEELKF